MHRLLLALSFIGCAPSEPVSPPVPSKRPHVVLISLDTTRADRLGSYGYTSGKTETLDALAHQGTRFHRAYSPAPLTIPAHISLFTGLYPPRHGVRTNGDGMLGAEHVTLTKELKQHGYRTAGSVSAFVTTRKWGFHRGFDAFYDSVPEEKNAWRGERPAVEVVDDALGWVNETGFDIPIYLWVHLYDAHFPLQAPDEYNQLLPGKPYDAEIAYVDDQVQRLVDAFHGEPTLFVVVGDHGEGLGEHGENGHGFFVYDSTQRVPWFMTGPGVPSKVVETPVSLVDVMPTVLDTLNLPIPASLDGRVAPHSLPVYMEAFLLQDRLGLAPHYGLVTGNEKLIDVPRPELYRLDEDPNELFDVASTQMASVVAMKQTIDGFGFTPRDPSAALSLDPEVAKQLEALGYVQPSSPVVPGTVLKDAKDHQDLIDWSQLSERLLRREAFEEADKVLQKLNERYPELVKAKVGRITALGRLGRMEEALNLGLEAIRSHPDDVNIASVLAGLLDQAGRWEEAARYYQLAAKGLPWVSHLRIRNVIALSRVEGQGAASLALAERYRAEHPDDRMIAGYVGLTYLSQKKIEEGVALLQFAGEARQPLLMVSFHLGAMAHQHGDLKTAEHHLQKEIEFHPTNVVAFRLLKDVYVATKNWKGMVQLAQRALEVRNTAEWSHVKALGLFNQRNYEACRRSLDLSMKRYPEASNLVLLDANLLLKEGKEPEAMNRLDEANRLNEKKRGLGKP